MTGEKASVIQNPLWLRVRSGREKEAKKSNTHQQASRQARAQHTSARNAKALSVGTTASISWMNQEVRILASCLGSVVFPSVLP